jgi:hypothetical protein
MVFPFSSSFSHKASFSSLNGLLIDGKHLRMASGPFTSCFEFGLKAVEPPNGRDIENGEKSSPENPCPDSERQLRERGRNHSVPIDKPQNENKKDKEENEPPEDLLPP